jgi:hypothetical protein
LRLELEWDCSDRLLEDDAETDLEDPDRIFSVDRVVGRAEDVLVTDRELHVRRELEPVEDLGAPLAVGGVVGGVAPTEPDPRQILLAAEQAIEAD